MKEIRVSAKNLTKYFYDMAVFTFPTDADRDAFFPIIGMTFAEYEERIAAGQTQGFTHVWNIMKKAGWVWDRLDGEFIVWLFPETDAEKLETCLKHHDWTYQMSDSHGVYMQGEAQLAEIKDLMRKVGEPLASQLYKKYDYWNKE